MKAFIIAAPHSGSGKSTIALGLMEVFRRRGLNVAPFKVGPDFIDPGYHRLVTHRPSINLDGWICGAEWVCDSFTRYAFDADIAVIEGAMGLFDGFGGLSEAGSAAQVAKLTGAPVLLVVDARGQSRSVAAMIKGFAEFDTEVRIAGVIFNQVSSDSHAAILRDAVADLEPQVPVLGCVPADPRMAIPSRHLGLVTAEDNPLPEAFLEYLGAVIRENIDLAALWHVAQTITVSKPSRPGMRSPAVKIAVARDEAFCFVYEENLRLLSDAGAELVPFSPLRDPALPVGVSGIYLPGGYPELHAAALSQNGPMRRAIAESVRQGMPVYAECGGFIYLTEGVEKGDGSGSLQEFVGIFPVSTRMLEKRKALGYREVELADQGILGNRGLVARGHEFHYSEITEMPAEIDRLYRVRRGDTDMGQEGYRIANCLASYIHLHFGSCPEMADNFVESCWKFKKGPLK